MIPSNYRFRLWPVRYATLIKIRNTQSTFYLKENRTFEHARLIFVFPRTAHSSPQVNWRIWNFQYVWLCLKFDLQGFANQAENFIFIFLLGPGMSEGFIFWLKLQACIWEPCNGFDRSWDKFEAVRKCSARASEILWCLKSRQYLCSK